MRLEAVSALAASAKDLRAWRRGALELLRPLVPFDAAIFHALSPRVPLETGVFEGLDRAALQATLGEWDAFGSLFAPVRARANREGVATELELPRSAREVFDARVARPLGQRSMCIGHLIVRAQVVSAIVLFSRRPRAFGPVQTERLRALLPALAVGDALHQHLDRVPLSSVPTRLACVDQRLTPRQQEIVDHVAQGHTNAEAASALELSVNVVRNHLVRIFERVGAANRADLVRLAVMTPAPLSRPGLPTRRSSRRPPPTELPPGPRRASRAAAPGDGLAPGRGGRAPRPAPPRPRRS
jgi:DNA-binding CsgD family transcriptional regulator